MRRPSQNRTVRSDERWPGAAGRRIPRQRGFALATTLWLLAMLTVATGYLAFWAEQIVADAWSARRETQAELEQRGVLATLLYLLFSRRMTIAGLSVDSSATVQLMADNEDFGFQLLMPVGDEMKVDGRWYQGLGETQFAVQDERGLVPLSESHALSLSALLGLLDVPFEQRDPLLAKLFDYIDADSLYRLNGAETAQYPEQEPPPNRDLLTPWEAQAVLGWREYPSLWPLWPRLTTLALSTAPNLNTAPARVLQTLPGIDRETAERLVAGRPYRSSLEANLAAGRELPGELYDYPLLPSYFLRLSLRHPATRREREIHIILTPSANKKPWLIDHAVELPWHETEPVVAAAAPSPLFAAPFPATAK